MTTGEDMNQICNNCGGEYIYRNGRWICRSCGAFKPEEISNEEVTLLYTAYQKLRLANFGDAEKEFDDIIEKYPQNPNAYWGRLMSKYGIKYERDFDGRMIPTCYATSIESVVSASDYKKALQYADDDTGLYYQKQVDYIERVRREWIEKASREKPYDIFICYKDSDLANGITRTEDSIAAQDLYIHLMNKGYRVFYSHESLRDKVGEKYEPYIFNALSTAKVMLVYGSKPEYITSTWLKNEWTRYEKRIRAGEKDPSSLLVACEGFSPAELPTELSSRQCYDASAKSFYSDLDDRIEQLIRPKKKSKAAAVSYAPKKKSKAPLAVTLLLLLAVAGAFGWYAMSGMGSTGNMNTDPPLSTTFPYDSAESSNSSESTDSTTKPSVSADSTTKPTISTESSTNPPSTNPPETTESTNAPVATEPVAPPSIIDGSIATMMPQTSGGLPTPEDPNASDKLPGYTDIDFGGKTFTIVGADGESDGFNSAKEIYSEEADSISLAVRERNMKIEQLYNCKIIGVASASPSADVLAGVMVGGNSIDLYTHHYSIDTVATSGNVYNLKELGSRTIDFSQPWWDQEFVNTYTVRNTAGTETLYSIVGDFALTAFDCTHAIIFNKEVLSDTASLRSTDPYELVRNMEWTMDMFAFMVKSVAQDTDADGTIDGTRGDLVGWIRTSHAAHGLHAGSGLSIISNVNGVFTFGLQRNSQQWTNVMDSVVNIWSMPEGQTLSYHSISETFASGNALFASELIGTILPQMNAYGAEFGVLPYPLLNEQQESYAHYVDNHFYAYSVPTSVSDIEAIGDFLAIYAYHSGEIVRPAYLDAYAYKYCTDVDSADMLRLIFDTKTYDPGYLTSVNLEGQLSNMILGGSTNVNMFVAMQSATVNAWIENYITGIDDNPSANA